MRMKSNYFVLVLAHSAFGRLKRLHIPHYTIHLMVCLGVFGVIASVGILSSYARMLAKVSEFNQMRSEKEALEKKYEELKRQSEERDVQLASLGNLASEVSIAFGIKRQLETGSWLSAESTEEPGYKRSVNQFDFLQKVSLPATSAGDSLAMLSNTTPSAWPIKGRISSSFGSRLDPFKGKGAFHSGIDLSARKGTAVVASADGRVIDAGWAGQYGRRVIINHGRNRLTTLYAHLTDYYVHPGEVVRRGQVIGRAGSTGRATSTHLHYEVRYRGVPVNPYKYLHREKSGFSELMVSD